MLPPLQFSRLLSSPKSLQGINDTTVLAQCLLCLAKDFPQPLPQHRPSTMESTVAGGTTELMSCPNYRTGSQKNVQQRPSGIITVPGSFTAPHTTRPSCAQLRQLGLSLGSQIDPALPTLPDSRARGPKVGTQAEPMPHSVAASPRRLARGWGMLPGTAPVHTARHPFLKCLLAASVSKWAWGGGGLQVCTSCLILHLHTSPRRAVFREEWPAQKGRRGCQGSQCVLALTFSLSRCWAHLTACLGLSFPICDTRSSYG